MKTAEEVSQRYKAWYAKNGRKRDPDKSKAHRLVAKAVQRGEIIKPSQCPVCGRTERIEAHHNDYSQPLKVLWFCNRCHRRNHRGGGEFQKFIPPFELEPVDLL